MHGGVYRAVRHARYVGPRVDHGVPRDMYRVGMDHVRVPDHAGGVQGPLPPVHPPSTLAGHPLDPPSGPACPTVECPHFNVKTDNIDHSGLSVHRCIIGKKGVTGQTVSVPRVFNEGYGQQAWIKVGLWLIMADY